jgi:Xaa-Pro dipeptidase
MVITVEPGLYFNDVSLNDKPKHPSYSPYYNMEKINNYKGIGGVRIEDTLLITENGSENFTIVPKEVDDIENLIMLSI